MVCFGRFSKSIKKKKKSVNILEWNFLVVQVKTTLSGRVRICLLKSWKVANDVPLSIVHLHCSTQALAHRSPLLCTRIPPTSPVFFSILEAAGLTRSKWATPLFKPLASHHAIPLLTTSRYHTKSLPWPSAPFAIWLKIASGSWSPATYSSHHNQLYRISPFPKFAHDL